MSASTLRKLALVGIPLVVLVWWLSGEPDSWPVAHDPPRPGPIVCFGDSLTRGHGVSEDESYPAILSGFTRREVVNLGRDGETSETAVERLDEATELRPAMVIVTLGGNDMLRRISPDETVRAMKTIFRRFRDAGAMVVFLGIDPPFVSGDRMELIRRLAREEKVLFVSEVMSGFWTDRSLMSDRIHPSAAGYRVLAGRVRDALGDRL